MYLDDLLKKIGGKQRAYVKSLLLSVGASTNPVQGSVEMVQSQIGVLPRMFAAFAPSSGTYANVLGSVDPTSRRLTGDSADPRAWNGLDHPVILSATMGLKLINSGGDSDLNDAAFPLSVFKDGVYTPAVPIIIPVGAKLQITVTPLIAPALAGTLYLTCDFITCEGGKLPC